MSLRQLLLVLGMVCAIIATPAHAATAPSTLDCDTQPCADVLPGATHFSQEDGRPYAVGTNADGTPVGWVVLSTDVVDIKAYSGKPLVTLVGLNTEGRITGGYVVHHSEPILLVGIPEQELQDFVASYAGIRADEKVIVGHSADTETRSVDVISGATVTVLAQNRTVLESARLVGQDVGVIARTVAVPGHFVEDEPPWTWAQLEDADAMGRLTVSAEAMGDPDVSQPFIDVYFGIADAPHVGIPLLGRPTWERARAGLAPGEHLLVVLGSGSNSFKGSGFVRGGIFDRVRVEQGLQSFMFRDLDYTNIPPPPVADAPAFTEGALFIARGLDPGARFDFVFLGSVFDGKGGFSRDFRTFKATWRVPKAVYILDGPDPESLVWRQAWAARPLIVSAVTVYLLMTLAVFAARSWSSGRMARLKRLHTAFELVSFVGLGLFLHLQPSVTQMLTFIDSLVHEFRWGLFLSDPLLFITWIFIAVGTVLWGRGVFCGWVCPYGAFNELLFKLGRWLKLPELELPDAIHFKARYLRYAVLALLVGVYLVSPETGERMAEVEPFKSTFFVAPWTRGVLLFGWWLILAGWAVFTYRPFCRYICPLGAGLALPSSFRLSGPHRRDFCTKCKICTKGCEPRAIRPDGSIDSRECLNCWECEANWRDDKVCPPLVKIRRDLERARAKRT